MKLKIQLVHQAWEATPYYAAWKGKIKDEAYILARDVFYAGAIEMMGLLADAAREKDGVKRLALEMEVAAYATAKTSELESAVSR